VLPRPSRAAYPCQRANAPLVAGFLLWLVSLSPAGPRPDPSTRPRRRRWFVAALIPLVGLTVFGLLEAYDAWRYPDGEITSPASSSPYIPAYPPNHPVGQGQGVHPGRVVWAHDPDATSWEGGWASPWDHVDAARLDALLASALQRLTGAPDDRAAWTALFTHVDRQRGRTPAGYSPGDSIAIKVNANSDGQPQGDTSPLVVRALLVQLVDNANVPPDKITVYDASRQLGRNWIRKATEGDERLEGVTFGVRFVVPGPRLGREVIDVDPASRIHLGALPDGVGAEDPPVRLPAAVTAATYLINASVLKPHSLAGISLTAKNHFGSLYREGGINDGWSPAFLHAAVGVQARDGGGGVTGRYSPLVDLMGHPDLGGKTVLYLLDGLYTPRTTEDGPPARWHSSPFDGHWTSSLLLSQDPVAIDSVALDLLTAESAVEPLPWMWGDLDNYLIEAALADSPPSGTRYDPDGDGRPLGSLGVHEHWSSPADRRYSRNMGRPEGIELVGIGPGTQPGAGATATRTTGAPGSASTVNTPPANVQAAPSHSAAGASP